MRTVRDLIEELKKLDKDARVIRSVVITSDGTALVIHREKIRKSNLKQERRNG